MTTAQNSNFANEDMNKLLSVSVRTTNHRSRNNLLATMRVKSHGTIVCMRNRFLDFQVSDNRYHQADFIRIPPDASVMTVVEHLTQVWFPKHPKLVTSYVKLKLLRAFQDDLLKVARTTGIKK